MTTEVAGEFEWDVAKAQANLRKHGVTFMEAARAFLDPFAIDLPDVTHPERLILLPTGQGKWEDAGESWRLANLLGARGVPNRVDLWGEEFDHDWNTWRAMLPKYLKDHA